MTFWRKDKEFEEFLEIARYVLDKKYIKDRTEYKNYPSPFYHVSMPYTVKGLETQLKEWEKEYKRYKVESNEWQVGMIMKLNNFLAYNLAWKNNKSAQQQFREANKVLHYFKREDEFLATD